MPGIYDGYKIALLDSSFFVSNFSKDVKDGLCSIRVYVADTFNSEIEQYRQILPSKRKNIYDLNIRFLNENLRVNTLNLESFGVQAQPLHNDVWGLLTLFAELNASAVVITGNELLIQKIILKGLDIDIYDLNGDCFVKSSSFPICKRRYMLTESVWVSTPNIVKTSENSTLYCKNGLKIELGKEIARGLEANLYLIKENSNLVAKIFKRDKLSASKYQNIKRLSGLNRELEINWAMFPIDVLYFDANCTNPAGFIEEYVQTIENLDEKPLFLGDPFNITEEDLLKKQSFAVDLCLKIVRQVCYLNTYGFFISDYNMSNFATRKNNDNSIQMWDTDSFGYESFFEKKFSPEYADCMNHPRYNLRVKWDAIASCNEALYQFVFTVLSLGDAPISEHTGKFKYDNPNYFAADRKIFFPQNIWTHLETVFRGNKDPSAEALLQQLVIAKKRFNDNPESDKTFKELYSEIIPGFIDELIALEAERQVEKNRDNKIESYENEIYIGKTVGEGSNVSFTNTSSVPVGKKKTSKLKSAILIFVIIVVILGAIGYYVSTTYSIGKLLNLETTTSTVVIDSEENSNFETFKAVG